MNLIDTYVNEVGRNLPDRMREDIEKETRSLIEDMLEDEAQKQGRPVDEPMIVDVLKRMGPPDKVASSYLPPRYLIGPKYYPTFIMVLRIVLTIMIILTAIGLGVELGQASPGTSVLTALGTGFIEMITSLIAAFGNVVLVFAILQWLNPEPKFDARGSEWDPRTMKAEPDPERIKTIDMVTGIAGNIILLMLLNVYPHWMGINWYQNGEWVHASVLTDAFFRFVPWMSSMAVGWIALHAYLLRQERWTTPARIAEIILHIASIVMLSVMISGPALVGFDSAELARLGWLDRMAPLSTVNDGLNLLIRISLGISLVLQVIEVAKMLYRLAGKRISLPTGLTN